MNCDPYWEIWDLVSRNCLMDFDSEADALDWIWTVIREEGIAATLALSLGSTPGTRADVTSGSALAERAFRRAMVCAEREAAIA
jgi:hypothetical protein